jgi:hypothetical protein
MKVGAVFSGSVAFLEPYHDRSRFHLSPDGTISVLRYAGLTVEAIWPQDGWLVFDSLATMHGPVSWPSRELLKVVGGFERVIRRRFWHPREIRNRRWLRRKSPEEYAEELLTITAQVDFVATKPR